MTLILTLRLANYSEESYILDEYFVDKCNKRKPLSCNLFKTTTEVKHIEGKMFIHELQF